MQIYTLIITLLTGPVVAAEHRELFSFHSSWFGLGVDHDGDNALKELSQDLATCAFETDSLFLVDTAAAGVQGMFQAELVNLTQTECGDGTATNSVKSCNVDAKTLDSYAELVDFCNTNMGIIALGKLDISCEGGIEIVSSNIAECFGAVCSSGSMKHRFENEHNASFVSLVTGNSGCTANITTTDLQGNVLKEDPVDSSSSVAITSIMTGVVMLASAVSTMIL